MYNLINKHDYKLNDKLLKKYVEILSQYFNEEKSFSIVIINDEEMINYNSEFRDKDYSTDVLTFCEEDDYYLGDILLNYNKVEVQAQEYNHSSEREFFFLITHGYLHLQGYDHLTEIDEKEMFDLQEILLDKINVRR